MKRNWFGWFSFWTGGILAGLAAAFLSHQLGAFFIPPAIAAVMSAAISSDKL